jgi:tetratricopeptide (TPR) repeat protein
MAEIKQAAEARALLDKAEDSDLFAKNYEKAIGEYSEVLKLLPNDDDSFIVRGEAKTKAYIYFSIYACYRKLDQLEKALDYINKAISINGNERSYYTSRAYLYVNLGEMEKAKADFEKGLELLPEKYHAESIVLFGTEIEELTGNKREAAVYLKKAIEHGGNWAEKAKKKLAEWGM